jgi:ABC-type Mn2+/Zn2+ transport system permease subunit
VQASGSFVPALMTAAVIGVVCALLSVAIIRRPITAADIRGDGPKKNRL